MSNEELKDKELEEKQELPEGYMTKEEWVSKGRNPDDWRSPEEWVKKGEEILPIVKKNLDKTKEELQDLKEQMQFVIDFNKKQEERIREEERNKIIAEYKAKQKEAFDNDDYNALTKAEQEKDEKLKKTQEQQQVQRPQGPDKEFEKFKQDNPWYESDDEMTRWANGKGRAIAEHAIVVEGKSRAEAFKEIADEARIRFKDKFENKAREKSSPVEGEATVRSKKGNGRSWDDIDPQERQKAKHQYKKIAEQMKLKGREYKEKDYLESYFE